MGKSIKERIETGQFPVEFEKWWGRNNWLKQIKGLAYYVYCCIRKRVESSHYTKLTVDTEKVVTFDLASVVGIQDWETADNIEEVWIENLLNPVGSSGIGMNAWKVTDADRQVIAIELRGTETQDSAHKVHLKLRNSGNTPVAL